MVLLKRASLLVSLCLIGSNHSGVIASAISKLALVDGHGAVDAWDISTIKMT